MMPIDTDNDLPGFAPLPQVAESDMSGKRGTDPDDNSDGGEQPIFRPHPFALLKGENAPKIALGQFLWRLDAITLHYNDNSGVHNRDAGQDVIDGWTAVTPTLNDANGSYLTSNEQNSFDELSGGWGNVYLYWEVDLDETNGTDSSPITSCYVTTATPSLFEVSELAVGSATSDRLLASGGTEVTGRYRVNLGYVPEEGENAQYTASDVRWPMFVLKRLLTAV
jgi:hypothetical protein